jgi:hypothetical protein
MEGRPGEVDVAPEGRPSKLDLYGRHLREVEVDKGGAGEVEANARPEGLLRRGWEELGLLTRGIRRAAEVVGEEVLGGLADLKLLLRGVVLWEVMPCGTPSSAGVSACPTRLASDSFRAGGL